MKKIFLLLIFVLTACAAHNDNVLNTIEKPEIFSDVVNRTQMIGAWVGESNSKDGGNLRFLDKRFADGTFEVHFKGKKPDGSSLEQTEVGFWGMSGGIYFTITRGYRKDGKFFPADTKNAEFYDAYKALKISPSEFTYKSLSTQDEFTVKRVSGDFSL